MDLAEIKRILRNWASTKAFIKKVYILEVVQEVILKKVVIWI